MQVWTEGQIWWGVGLAAFAQSMDANRARKRCPKSNTALLDHCASMSGSAINTVLSAVCRGPITCVAAHPSQALFVTAGGEVKCAFVSNQQTVG